MKLYKISGLLVLVIASCAPEVKPAAGTVFCTSERYDMAYTPRACEPCVNIPCRGPELPPCSACGDRACVLGDGGFCCETPAKPPEPCKPQVRGAP